MDKEYNKKRYILLVILCLLFIFSIFLFNLKNKDNNEEIIYDGNKVKLLSDYSRFFTVNSCVYKYITYLQSKNVDSIIKVLDEEYKNTKNINSSNVLENVENLSGNFSFVSKKIYYENIDNYNIKYYVYGYLTEDTIDGYGEKLDRYYVVLFDTKKNIFTITPYNEFNFKEVTNG